MAELQEVGKAALRVIAAMLVLATVAMIVRGAAITKARKALLAHDYTIVAAYICFVAIVSGSIQGLYDSGGSLDIESADLDDPHNPIRSSLRMIFVFRPVFTSTITLVKISILLFYRLIFTTPRFRLASLIVGILCVAWFVAFVIFGLCLCTPVDHFWTEPQDQCFNYGMFIQAYEITNIAIDIAILALPIWMIKGLQLSTWRKFAVGGIFALGSFVIIICGLRMSHFINETSRVPGAKFGEGLSWSVVELAIAIVCACLPTYGPLLKSSKGARSISSWYQSRQTNRLVSMPSSETAARGSQYNKMGSFGEGGRCLTSVAAGHDYSANESSEAVFPLKAIKVHSTVEVQR